MSAEVLWGRYKDVAMAFYDQLGGQHGTGVVKYSTHTPFYAVKASNNKYILIKTFTRARGVKPQGSPNPWGPPVSGAKQYPIWVETDPEVVITLPALKTSSVHYHYDVFRIPIGEFKELRRCKDKQLIEINNI